MVLELVGRKYNDSHDEHGRFSSGDGGSSDVATGSVEAASRVMDETPSLVSHTLPFGAALLAPDGRFFGDQNTNFDGTSHDQLARKLGFDGLSSAMDKGFVRTRMHDSTVSGWGRQIDIEAHDMEGVRRAVQNVDAPPDTKVYYDTRREHGRGTVAMLARGGDEQKLGSYGRAVAAGGMYDPEAYNAKGWRGILGRLIGRKFNDAHDERGRFASGDGGSISGGAAGRLTHALATKGGFTYSPKLKSSPRVGKALSIHPEREKVISGRKVTLADVKAFVKGNADLFGDSRSHVGGWRDGENGKVYLDVSTVVSTDAEAEKLGREHKQEAYYDLATHEEVRLRARDKGQRQAAGLHDDPPRRNGRGATGVRGLPQRRDADKAGRDAVVTLQFQNRVRSLLHDRKFWDDIRRRATVAALPIITELYMGGVEAALRIAAHQGIRVKEIGEKYNDNHDEHGRFASSDGGAQGSNPQRAQIAAVMEKPRSKYVVSETLPTKALSDGWIGQSSFYSPKEGVFLSRPGWDHEAMARDMLGKERADASPGTPRDDLIKDGFVRVVGTELLVAIEANTHADLRDAAAAVAKTHPDVPVSWDTREFGTLANGRPAMRDYGTGTATEVAAGEQSGNLGPVGRALRDDSLYDPEAYNAKATKDGPTALDQQIAQQLAIDRARLANEWWNTMETTIRNQLEKLLGPAIADEAGLAILDVVGTLDIGGIIDGVAQMFGPERAQRIAVTETTRVMGQAAQATYNILGAQRWEWRTAMDDRVCQECEDAKDGGPYPIDEPFEPAHVRCRCWPVPLVGSKEWYAEKEAGHTGAMVALFPPASLANKLALDGGEPADDLHVTLAFLGEAAEIDGPAVLAAVKRVAKNFAPLTGEVSGVGRFSIPDGDAFYASVDLPTVTQFRQALVDAISDAGVKVADNHGFTAHVTLAYLEHEDENPLDRMESRPVAFDSVVVALGDERTIVMLGGKKDFDEDKHSRDERGRFALAEHIESEHKLMGHLGKHAHQNIRELLHRHGKHGAVIIPGGAIVTVKDFDEEKHPRDERGRFADSGYLGGTMDQSVGYDGPPPGSKGALDAASREYKWLKDPSAIPTVSEFPGAKTPVDTPEIIAERLQVPQQSIEISAAQAERMAQELKAEQDAGVRQDREAHIVLGIPASAKSALVADPLAVQMGARLADSDIAKSIVAKDLGFTDGRVNGADGYAGIVHEASSEVNERYIADAMARGDNLVIPKVGDNYDKIVALTQSLKDAGYTVKTTFVDVKPEEGMRRNVARYYATGRFVDPLNTFVKVDSKPEATYERLKAEGVMDGYTRIDNNGLPGTQRVVEGTNPVVSTKAAAGAAEAGAFALAGLRGRAAPSRDDLRRLTGRKYNENHDERGRFATSDGLASDGEPIRVSRDIEGTKTFAKIVDAMRESGDQRIYPSSDYSHPLSELAQLMDTLPGHQDVVAHELAIEKGFDAPPKVATPEEIDRLVAAGAPDLWRGVDKVVAAEAFIKGDYYAGMGTYGSGSYFIDSNGDRPSAALNFAGGYAGTEGAVIHATLAADAKIADYETIHEEAASQYVKASATRADENDPHKEAVRHILYDDGRYAMAKGYDAIKVSEGGIGQSQTAGDQPYYVVLNRGKMIVEDKIYESKGQVPWEVLATGEQSDLRKRVGA